MRVNLLLDKKTVENQDWATRPLCCQATGPSGRQAPGLSRAEGPDLHLAKPRVRLLSHLMIN